MSLFDVRRLFRAGPSAIPKNRVEGRSPRGLRLLAEFITGREQEEIAAWVAADVTWSCGSFDGHRLETYVEPRRPLPAWGTALGRRMREAGIFDCDPDYLHLIGYQAGQGIARHVDRESLGAVVAGLTLGSSRVFELARTGRRDPSVRVLLLPGDLYVIAGGARYGWEHGVPVAKEDQFGGRVYPRSPGWSATWRTVDRDAPLISEYTRGQESAGTVSRTPRR